MSKKSERRLDYEKRQKLLKEEEWIDEFLLNDHSQNFLKVTNNQINKIVKCFIKGFVKLTEPNQAQLLFRINDFLKTPKKLIYSKMFYTTAKNANKHSRKNQVSFYSDEFYVSNIDQSVIPPEALAYLKLDQNFPSLDDFYHLTFVRIKMDYKYSDFEECGKNIHELLNKDCYNLTLTADILNYYHHDHFYQYYRIDKNPENQAHENKLDENNKVLLSYQAVNGTHEHIYNEKLAILRRHKPYNFDAHSLTKDESILSKDEILDFARQRLNLKNPDNIQPEFIELNKDK